MQYQCEWKTLTNVERVRIWKEAVVCSFMVLRLEILKESTTGLFLSLVVHYVAVIPNNSLLL